MITNLNKNKNIIISICGLNRSVNLVIKQLNKCFINYNIFYILILSKSNDKKYLNLNNKIIDYSNIKEIIYLDDIEDSSFGNSLNYSNKLSHSINIFENKYDYYFILRSDFILKNINLDMILYNKIYFSNKNINNNIICSQRINNSIIISKSYSLIKKLSKLHEYNKNNLNYLDINLFNFLNEEKINYELIKIDYKYILSRCNIIAICGDSGSGKTVLANTLNLLFKKDGLTLETDRYHKWERGNENYKKYTHLNPYANNIELMNEDVYKLKIGENIYQVDYDHKNGIFSQKKKIKSKKNIILCGLHTLYKDDMNKLLNLKIYLDTDRELIKKWKIKRDTNERNYNIEKILEQIKTRENDYKKYILYQKKNADIIINFFLLNEKLECNFIIKNMNFIKIIIEKISNLNYNFIYSDNLIIKLKNKYYHLDKYFLNTIKNKIDMFTNNYLIEILYLISILI